jgi:hypothetical protein
MHCETGTFAYQPPPPTATHEKFRPRSEFARASCSYQRDPGSRHLGA